MSDARFDGILSRNKVRKHTETTGELSDDEEV